MNSVIEDKLKKLPKTPGVYFHKNANGEIIYIGKAANLRNRVRQYFQKSRTRDPKTEALVMEIANIDWVEVETELDALFLEAELIRRYMPKYNILLRDDKSLTYVRIDYNSNHPTVTLTRRPLDDGARYFGPYYSGLALRRGLKYLRRIFPFSTHKTNAIPKRACLQYHLGLCPGIEQNKTDIKSYRANLKKLMQYLKGERVQLMRQIERDMKTASKKKDYETAAQLRNQLFALRSLSKQIIFSDREFLDISKDQGLSGLSNLLTIMPPRRIEGYDISHMQGTDNVASMVVFISGVPDKAAYRKFRLRIPGNDDFAHMNEAIIRRLSEKNRKAWGVPDLFLIDGGKGQLSAALKARDAHGYTVPMIGLAKRDEEIVMHKDLSGTALNRQTLQRMGGVMQETGEFMTVLLPKNSHIVKLLQRIRDESHRFAVSYHSVLKTKRQTASLLDDIPTIGPATRKKLLKTFGSVRGIMLARDWEIEKSIGQKKASILKQYLRAYRKSDEVSNESSKTPEQNIKPLD